MVGIRNGKIVNHEPNLLKSDSGSNSAVARLVMCLAEDVLTDTEKLARWEQYRTEMENFEKQMVKCAESFAELKAYKDAADCYSKADAARFICGRMPHKFGT